MRPTCVLVHGTPRSGTSLTAKILSSLGVPMGRRFNESDPDMCRDGFHSDADFDETLSAGFDVFRLPVVGAELPAEIRSDVEALIDRRVAEFPLWGFKQIYGVAAVPYLARVCSVRVVRLIRCPRASRLSFAMHTEHAYETIRSIGDWSRAAGDWLESGYPTLRVEFDDLIGQPGECVRQIAKFVGVPDRPEVAALVDPALKRF